MRLISLSLVAVVLLSACSKKSSKTATPNLKTEKDSFSYIFGLNVGSFLQNYKVTDKDIDAKLFEKGIKEAMLHGDSSIQISPELRDKVVTNYLSKLKYAQNIEEGKKYLAAKSKEAGYKTTASGLIYKMLVQGNGPKPALTDTAIVHYTGKLIDGSVFDSSVRGPEESGPAKFPVNGMGLIPGFKEALQMMPVGSKMEVIIPSDLAYGKQGRQNPYTGQMMMEPNKTLIFEIELLGVK